MVNNGRVRRPNEVKWPSDVLMWIKIYTDKYPHLCNRVDYFKQGSDKAAKYQYKVTLNFIEEEPKTFEQIGHCDGWTKRGAVCQGVEYLLKNGYIEHDIPLPDTDYTMNKLAEVELMTESAGGYNFNSAIMVVMRKVAVNIQTRQINTEVTQASTHFQFKGDTYQANREGRNKDEARKMVCLDLCAQLIEKGHVVPRPQSNLETFVDDDGMSSFSTSSTITVLDDLSEIGSEAPRQTRPKAAPKEVIDWFQYFHFKHGKQVFKQPAEFELSKENSHEGTITATLAVHFTDTFIEGCDTKPSEPHKFSRSAHTELLARKLCITDAIHMIYSVENQRPDLELPEKVADPQARFDAFQRTLDNAYGWNFNTAHLRSLRQGVKFTAKKVNDTRYDACAIYVKEDYTQKIVQSGASTAEAQKMAALKMVGKLIEDGYMEGTHAAEQKDLMKINRLIRPNLKRTRPLKFNFEKEKLDFGAYESGDRPSAFPSHDMRAIGRIDPFIDRMRRIQWPSCPANWLKVLQPFVRQKMKAFDFEADQRADEGRYFCYGTVVLANGERANFNTEAHSATVAKKYAAIKMIEYLLLEEVFQRCDVKLPQIDEWVSLSKEYRDLLEDSGGWHINSAAGRINDFVTFTSVAIDYTYEQVSEFRIQCVASFWFNGKQYIGTRQGLNEKESKKMAELDLVSQMHADKLVECAGDTKIGSKKSIKSQESASAYNDYRFDEFDKAFADYGSTVGSRSCTGTGAGGTKYESISEVYNSTTSKLKTPTNALPSQTRYSTGMIDLQGDYGPEDYESEVGTPSTVTPKSEVHPDDSVSCIGMRKLNLSCGAPAARDIRDMNNNPAIQKQHIQKTPFQKMANLPAGKDITYYSNLTLSKYTECKDWILGFEIQNERFFSEPTKWEKYECPQPDSPFLECWSLTVYVKGEEKTSILGETGYTEDHAFTLAFHGYIQYLMKFDILPDSGIESWCIPETDDAKNKRRLLLNELDRVGEGHTFNEIFGKFVAFKKANKGKIAFQEAVGETGSVWGGEQGLDKYEFRFNYEGNNYFIVVDESDKKNARKVFALKAYAKLRANGVEL